MMKTLGKVINEMSHILNNSLGGIIGTTQGPTTSTTDFYQQMVDSHQSVVSQAIDKQSEISKNQDDNDTLKEIFLSW